MSQSSTGPAKRNRFTADDPAKTEPGAAADSNEPVRDLGFGNRVTSSDVRLINPDGSFNVRRTGLSFLTSIHPYHLLITMSWRKFMAMVVLAFFALNLFFAVIYLVLGTDGLAGLEAPTAAGRFAEVFFFSAQTFTTVGYGRINPVGFWPSLVAALESLTGLLTFALATGLLFARFSRPGAKVLFSRQAIFAPYNDGSSFQFRLANARNNQLLEVEVQVSLSRVVQKNGQDRRQFDNLLLERNRISFFPLSWTVVHPIDQTSPLYGLTIEELQATNAEFLIIVKSFDDTFSQFVYARYSYRADELVWGARFPPIFAPADGKVILALDHLSDTVPAELPLAATQTAVEDEEKIA